MFKLSTSFVVLTAALAVFGAPTLVSRHEGHDDSATSDASSTHRDNALDAQGHNSRFAALKATDSCSSGEMACVEGAFAQCIAAKWVVQPCAGTLRCYALPLVNKPGTSLVCDTQEDASLRFEAAGVTGGTKGNAVGDEDLPFCEEDEVSADEDEEEEYVPRELAGGSLWKIINRRQDTETKPLTLATLPPSTPTASGSASPTSEPVVTPTVVIGSNGIVTVTVVSTVFATDCAAPTETPSGSSIPFTVSGTITATFSASGSGAATASPPPARSSSGAPADVTLIPAPVSSAAPSAASAVITLIPAPVPTTSKGGRFNFSSGPPAAAATLEAGGSGYY